MIGKHENNRYYPEYCTQGSYYFNPEASEGEIVYIPEYQFDGKDFLSEGDVDMYTMEDLRTAARNHLEEIEGYDFLSDKRKAEELDRLVQEFIDWCGDGEAWCCPETYFAA